MSSNIRRPLSGCPLLGLTLQTWALELIGIRCISQPQMGPWSSEWVLHRLMLGLKQLCRQPRHGPRNSLELDVSPNLGCPSSMALCRPSTSRGWTTQQIPMSSTAHVCKTTSQKKAVYQWPRFDDATDSTKFHDPPKTPEAGRSNRYGLIRKTSSKIRWRPNTSGGWTTQGIPANGMAHSCKQSPQKSTLCQSPRLDVATDFIKVHSPRIPGTVRAPWPLAGPTPVKVGRRNRFQQVPRPMSATSSRQIMQRVGSISMSSNEFRQRVQARQRITTSSTAVICKTSLDFHSSRGWTTQRIPMSDAAHECKTSSQKSAACQWPRLDDATIPTSSATLWRPNNSRGRTT